MQRIVLVGKLCEKTHIFFYEKQALDWRNVGIKHRRLILLWRWESILVTFFITEEVYL